MKVATTLHMAVGQNPKKPLRTNFCLQSRFGPPPVAKHLP